MIISSRGHLVTFGQEKITKTFLSDLFQKKINEISLDNSTITEKDIMTDKMGIMDIKAVLNNKVQCDIEMQVVSQEDIEKRILFYMSKEFTKTISKGNEYGMLNKTIAVLIADFKMESISKVPKYATKWNFREEQYPEYILTDALEIYIIELPKLTVYEKNTKNERLNLWVKFIKEPEVKIMFNENDDEKTTETKEAIMDAQKRYEELQRDKHEMELAELREKYILDQNSLIKTGFNRGKKAGIAEGKKAGIAEGKKAGIAEGVKQRNIEIAKKMLKEKIDIETIAKLTDLTKSEIESLKVN